MLSPPFRGPLCEYLRDDAGQVRVPGFLLQGLALG